MVALINYNRYRATLEKLYEDLATVSRYVEVDKPSGETVLSEEPVVVYAVQPCRLSQKALGQNNQTEAQNDIRYETKLFISPDILILQGDVIEVTKAAVIRSYTAGEPFSYSSHQEISLQRKDLA